MDDDQLNEGEKEECSSQDDADTLTGTDEEQHSLLVGEDTQRQNHDEEKQHNLSALEDTRRQNQVDGGDREKSMKYPITSLQEMIGDLIMASYERFKSKPPFERFMLIVGILLVLFSSIGDNWLSGIYWDNGGGKGSVVAWSYSLGWPVLLLFLVPFYIITKTRPALHVSKTCVVVYLMVCGLDFGSGKLTSMAYQDLPTSLVTFLRSTSLVSAAIFGYLFAQNKLYISTLNAIIVIIGSAAMIGTDSNKYLRDEMDLSTSDRAKAIAAAMGEGALQGLTWALSEWLFSKFEGRGKEGKTKYIQILEFECLVKFITFGISSASFFPILRRLPWEASNFDKGGVSYAMVLFGFAITSLLGTAGNNLVILLASTVTAGFVDMLDFTVAGVSSIIFFHDDHSAYEIVAILLCIWGFLSEMFGRLEEHFWTEFEDTALVNAVVELRAKGTYNYRDRSKTGFKAGYCVALAQLVEDELPGHFINADQICIRLRRLRKQLDATKKMLKNDTLFEWDSERGCITCKNTSSFDDWIQKNNYARDLLGTPFPHYSKLKPVFENARGGGSNSHRNANRSNTQGDANGTQGNGETTAGDIEMNIISVS